MDKVNQLLEKAWHEAAKEGIALTSVQFEMISTVCGEVHYARHEVAGKSMKPKVNSHD